MIKAAAIYYGGAIYTLPAPARHHDIINYMAGDLGLPSPGKGEQGFLSEQESLDAAMAYSVFVDRVRAKEIAERCGQIKEGYGRMKQLFTEDLW